MKIAKKSFAAQNLGCACASCAPPKSVAGYHHWIRDNLKKSSINKNPYAGKWLGKND